MAGDPTKPGQSCLEQYHRLVTVVQFCATIAGGNIGDPDFKINGATYAMLILSFCYFCCTGYTIYVGLTNDGDITVILQTCCFVGVAVQATVKLLSYLAHKENMYEIYIFLEHTFTTYESRGERYRNALSKGIVNIKRILKLFMSINIGVVVTCSTVPMIYYAMYQEKTLIMQYLLPGLDPDTNTGYFLLTVIHFFSLCLGMSGTFATDMYLLIFVGNIPLLKDILRCKFDDLNDLLSRNNKPTRTEIHASIVEVVVWHQNYLRILNTVNSVFFVIIFVYVSGCAAGIMSTLYCMLAGAWPAAPFLLLYSYLTLYVYCGLGTIVDKSNEECTELIYTRCRWYDLPVKEQRFIQLMLRASQTAPSLTVGQMMPLNVATGLQLTKALFSIVMLLLSTDGGVRDAK